MALTQITYPAFTLDAATGTSFGGTTSSVALPGTPGSDALVRVANLGPNTVSVRLTVGAGTVTLTNGIAVLPGQVQYLAITTGNDHIAGIAHGSLGMGSTVNIATGS
jgi:hypothetical protein